MPVRDVVFNLLGRDEVTPALTRAGATATRTATQFDALNAAMVRSGDRMIATGRKLTSHLTLPILAIGGYAVKAATDFNASMTRIQTQAGASAREVQYLTKQVLAMKNVQFGPNAAAEALYHLESVGLRGAKAMRDLRQAENLAAVGGADLGDTVNALAGAWRTGIRGAKDFHQAAATVNAVIGAGNMHLADFNAALSTGILPSAKTFGLTLKDVGSALALFTDEGVPAEVAATRLRMSFSLLGAPSAKAEKELKSIGLTGLRLANDMRKPQGLIRAIGDLKSHLEDPKFHLSLSEQAQLLSHAFGGGRSSSAILSLINNFDVLKLKQDQVTKSLGNYNHAVKVQQATPQAQFKTREAELQKAAIILGKDLLPAATSLVKEVSGLFRGFDRLSPATRHWIEEALKIAVVLGPALAIGGRLVKMFALMWRVAMIPTKVSGGFTWLARTTKTTATESQAAYRATGTAATESAVQVDMASMQVKASLLSQQSAYERAAAVIAVSESNKAKAAADSARAIAVSLKGTDSMLAEDAAAADRNAAAYARAMQLRANASVKSAAVITETSIAATRALGGAERSAAVASRSRMMRGTGFGLALGWGIGGQFLGQGIAGHAPQGSLRNKLGTGVSDSATGALIGSIFGPEGAAIGALGGAAFGWFTSGAKAAAEHQQKRLAAISKLLDPTKAAATQFTNSILAHGHRAPLRSFDIAVGALQKQGLMRVGAKAGLTEWDLEKAITGSQADFNRVNKVMRATKGITLDQANALGALRAAYDKAGPAARQLAFEQGRTLDSFFKTGTVADLLTGKLENLNKAHLTGRQSQTLFRNATDAVTAAVTANGRSLNTNSLFGQQNIIAIKAAGVAAIQHAQAVYDQTKNLGKADQALAADRQALIRAATQAGLSKKAVKLLLDQLGVLGRTKPDVKIKVDTATAMRQVLGFKTWLRLQLGGNLGGAGLITVPGAGRPAKPGTGQRGNPGQAGTRFGGALASGGRIGPNEWGWVGERGWEGYRSDSRGQVSVLSHENAVASGWPSPKGYANGTSHPGGHRIVLGREFARQFMDLMEGKIQEVVIAEADFAAGH